MCFVVVSLQDCRDNSVFPVSAPALSPGLRIAFISIFPPSAEPGKSSLMLIRHLFLLNPSLIFLADMFPAPHKYSAARVDIFFYLRKLCFSCMRMFSQSKTHLIVFSGPMRLSMLCLGVLERLPSFNHVG